MHENEIFDRMDALELRLVRLEELLGANSTPPLQATSEEMTQTDVTHASAANIDESATPLLTGIGIVDYHQPPASTPPRQSDLEQLIGLKWAGWIGAVVLVIGAALGIKFAYGQGWFAVVTPAVGLAMLALAGVALIAAGEWVYRKVNTVSAAGLFGSGVAVLFIVSYAGYRYFDLYTPGNAFVFMGICTLIGAGVARRGQMVSIAVLSLIGGALAPALLGEGHFAVFGFLVYLLMLQSLSLILAAWEAAPKWWTLRGLSLATTSIWVAVVSEASPRETLLTFITVFAVLYQVEIVWSAWHSRLGKARASAGFSLLVTSLFILAGLHLLDDSGTTVRTFFVLGTAVATAAIAAVCRKQRHRPAESKALAIGYAAQTLALIVLAIPVALPSRWVVLAWAVLAVAIALIGRISQRFSAASARLSAEALPVISLAVVKWIAVDIFAARLAAPWTPSLALISGALLLGALVVIYLLTAKPVAAGLIPRRIPNLLVGQSVAVLLCLGSFAIDRLFNTRPINAGAIFADPHRAEQVALSIYWSIFALVSIGCGFTWRTAALRYVGLALFALTLIKVAAIDLSQVSSGYRILSFMGVGILLLITSAVYGKLSPVLLAKVHEQ